MSQTVFYERRRENKYVEMNQRRTLRRKIVERVREDEQRRLATLVRRSEREVLRIPVRFHMQGKELPGYTKNISLEGLLAFTEAAINTGTPMTMQFSFGENAGNLKLSGEVVFCRAVDPERSQPKAIGVKFSGIGEFERKILDSAVQGLKIDIAKKEKSFFRISVSTDTLVKEAENISRSKDEMLQDQSVNRMNPERVLTDSSESPKQLFDRRHFELPVSFVSRRQEQRRKRNLPPVQERRFQEDELTPIKALRIKIASLETHPRESIKCILGEISGIDSGSVEESSKIRALGLDSFQLIEMMAAIETVYDISIDEGAMLKVSTVKDLIDIIEGYVG